MARRDIVTLFAVWSSSVGASVLATAMVQIPWTLRFIHEHVLDLRLHHLGGGQLDIRSATHPDLSPPTCFPTRIAREFRNKPMTTMPRTASKAIDKRAASDTGVMSPKPSVVIVIALR